jgi:[glutamine synthetase] adenylyltransferase / [glutamine synthetase]-adenylyl-L-tyrosine phosphorylase
MQRLLDTPESAQRARALLLSSSPDPNSASRHLMRFEQAHPDVAGRVTATPNGLQSLIAVFSYSNFLSDELLQHPEWLDQIAGSPELYRVLSAEEIRRRLEEFLGPGAGLPGALPLAVFRRRELLRILLRDVLGHATLSEVTEELSNLADAILDVTYSRIRSELVRRHGVPRHAAGDGTPEECGFSVIALGKLGGRELNYSSDIDLMFVYGANGETDGTSSITNKEFFKKVANLCTDLLSTYTAEGMCYRVDLRLRPDGRLGEVCLSADGAKSYYANRGRDWELQMLIKGRVAAGEPGPGRSVLEGVEPQIYSSTLDFSAVEAVSLTRERIHEKLATKRANDAVDVKLARGGIRDVEFLVQCLQRLHGGRDMWVRHRGTLFALRRLCDKDLLSEAEYSRLASAYEFLRYVEHRLQVLDDRQTHTLPLHKDDLEVLARKLPQRELGRLPSAEKLLHQLNLHLEEVQETYERVIHSQQPLYYSAPAPERRPPAAPELDLLREPASTNLIRFLDERAPGLAETLASRQLRRGSRAMESFLEKVYANPEYLNRLNTNPVLAHDTLDLFENSPHFAEELMRHPELIDELAGIRDQKPRLHGDLSQMVSDAVELRRFFRREMLHIQAESVCVGPEIFHTLGRTSDLADSVICTAYTLARNQVTASLMPETAGYVPGDQMMVIALGRLGMREFDLGSDADLNFVLPDADISEMVFWTRVAERMIDLISAYTGEGVMFSVDTRLRPNGREGQLVQTVTSYREYLSSRAEAWEGITYMKSRAVAGNSDTATRFLHELQDVDWRRYGQSGRSRTDLRNMRARLEREQGESNPLKAGPGGFYDIDFSLMYLRLKSAGIFYKVLNTPERIDIIEKMGHLDRADAEFLQDAAAFYRAIDHGLRIYSGHAEGNLPHSEAQLDTLTRLVRRWTPERLHDAPLADKLEQIQTRTRAFFKRLFG